MYIEPKSRTERPRKTKIGTEVAHITHDSDTTFKVKWSKVNLQEAGHIVAASRTACFLNCHSNRILNGGKTFTGSTTPGRGVVDPVSFPLIFDHAPCPGQKILEINIEAVCDSYPSCFALTQTVRAHRESLRRVIQNRFQSGPKSIDPGNLVEICLQLFLVISSQTRTDERTVTIA